MKGTHSVDIFPSIISENFQITNKMSQVNQRKILVADASNDFPENPTPCFKLIIDCWELILDHLALKDIIALSKTCKPLQQLAGCYFREHFSNNIGCDFQDYSDNDYGYYSYGGIWKMDDYNMRPDFIQFISMYKIIKDSQYAKIFLPQKFLRQSQPFKQRTSK